MSNIYKHASVDMLGTAICQAIGLDPGKVTLLKIGAEFDAANHGDPATIDVTLICAFDEAEAIAEVLRGSGHNVTLNVSNDSDE